MSFIITLYVREGIVMASDSRLSLNYETVREGKPTVNLAVAGSDANYKTFLTPSRIGISTFGAADIQGVPIAGYIESFISERLEAATSSPEEAASSLLRYFREFAPPPQTQFHVAGYVEREGVAKQEVWLVNVAADRLERKNPEGQQGATWGGEADVLTRLLHPLGALDSGGQLTSALPHFPIPFRYFTLQDAIDFAIFALRATIDAIRFQPRPKTVGGPIDVLVIKPHEAVWIQRKELRGESPSG
jgi:hypothetical protein